MHRSIIWSAVYLVVIIMPIHYMRLRGKYVEYRDRNEATRIGKVRKVWPRKKVLSIKTWHGDIVLVPMDRVLAKVTARRREEIDWD